MDILKYIDAILCIKYPSRSFVNPEIKLNGLNLTDVHKNIAEHLYYKNLNTSLIFDNDITLNRSVTGPAIDKNDVKIFLTRNFTWDIIVLGTYDDNKITLFDGYQSIYTINNNNDIIDFIDKPYIMSKRYINKALNKKWENIEKYYFNPPLMETFKPFQNNILKYTLGKVQNIKELQDKEIEYSWNKFSL